MAVTANKAATAGGIPACRCFTPEIPLVAGITIGLVDAGDLRGDDDMTEMSIFSFN
jgi:hypothetical protein